MIRVEKLCKTYGKSELKVKALKEVSVQINDGEMIAIIGSSGSGKSTLLRILGGLDTEVEGDVFYDDVNIVKMNDAQLSAFRLNNIGFVFQFFNLVPELTAEENIKLPQMINKKKAIIPKDVLTQLCIEDRLKHYPSELSGGQQQRVAIARALANNPKLILADEPTGALDSRTAAEIMELFRELNKDGHTIIIVTHDLEIANQCDRIIEISDGRII